jgi:TolB-like protein/tetratricopeptide (TPR) repeat protein
VVSGTFASASVPRQQRRGVIWALAGAGILASMAAGGAWFSNRHATGSTADSSVAPSGAALVPFATGASAVKSIGVMPLVNLSRDTGDAYFAAGMTAEVTNALSRIPGLRVASGNEGATHEVSANPADVGKALNVNMVLFGTVQRDKTRLRVTARLVKTSDGITVWSDMFERDSKDVFKVQDDISSEIVAAISPELTSAAAVAPVVARAGAPATANHGTNDLQAYDLYLRGRYFFDKRGEAGLRRALDYFGQAAQRDSNFARAYAGIANVYAILPLYANVRVDSLMPLALTAINRAVALDSTLPEAFASRATLLQASWRWADAERDYKRALALDPNNAPAHQWYGELLLLNGRVAEAITQLKRATVLDPLSPIAFGSYSLALAVYGLRDSAILAARRAVELDSASLAGRFMLGTVYLEAGRLPEAIRELESAQRIDSTSVQTRGLLGYAYAKQGGAKRASELAKALAAQIGQVSGAAAAAARVFLGLGDNARALTLLDRAAADRDSFYSSESLAESFFDPIRSDPRFAAIVAKVGLDRRILTK